MHSLSIKTSSGQNGIPLVEVSGSLDAHNFEQLEQAFDSYFENGIYRLVVDISGLDYMSSAGAGVLIGAAGRTQANDGGLAVAAPKQNVQEIFDLLGICHIFPVMNSQEEAFSHFSSLQR